MSSFKKEATMTNEEIAKQLESYLVKLNESLKDCNDGILLQSEAPKIIQETISKVKEILPENSRPYKEFDSEIIKLSLWWKKSKYVDKKDCNKFEQLSNILKKVLINYH